MNQGRTEQGKLCRKKLGIIKTTKTVHLKLYICYYQYIVVHVPVTGLWTHINLSFSIGNHKHYCHYFLLTIKRWLCISREPLGRYYLASKCIVFNKYLFKKNNKMIIIINIYVCIIPKWKFKLLLWLDF